MNCLEEYLKIFEQYPLNDKRLKKERNITLHNWRVNKNDYPQLKYEVGRFIKENGNIINCVFIKRAVCPLIKDCLNNNEYDFINELIQTIGADEAQKISTEDIINIYCEYIHWEKSSIQTVDEILLHSHSKLLLEIKFNLMQKQIYYSIHELPIGILLEDIGILTRKSYIEYFSEFEEIAKKLNKKTDIDKIRVLYEAYFDYLNNKKECASFEEYLNKNNIDYKFLFYYE